MSDIPAGLQKILKKYAYCIDDYSIETDTGDGYWIYLKYGWHWQDIRTVHEWTLKDLAEAMLLVEEL